MYGRPWIKERERRKMSLYSYLIQFIKEKCKSVLSANNSEGTVSSVCLKFLLEFLFRFTNGVLCLGSIYQRNFFDPRLLVVSLIKARKGKLEFLSLLSIAVLKAITKSYSGRKEFTTLYNSKREVRAGTQAGSWR